MIATGLERLWRSPFLATRAGQVLALCLRATLLPPTARNRYRLYETEWLPGIGFAPSGQTWGATVLVLKGRHSPRLEAHEACHVEQYRRLTSLGFLSLYTWQWLTGLFKHRDLYRAYWTMPLEAEARAAVEKAGVVDAGEETRTKGS